MDDALLTEGLSGGGGGSGGPDVECSPVVGVCDGDDPGSGVASDGIDAEVERVVRAVVDPRGGGVPPGKRGTDGVDDDAVGGPRVEFLVPGREGGPRGGGGAALAVDADVSPP